MAKKPLTPFAVTLTGKQARHLRALAHEMRPLRFISHATSPARSAMPAKMGGIG